MISNIENNSFYRPTIYNYKDFFTFLLVSITVYTFIQVGPIHTKTISPYAQILDCKKFTSYNQNPCTKPVTSSAPKSNAELVTDKPAELDFVYDAIDSGQRRVLGRSRRQIDGDVLSPSSIEPPLTATDKCNSVSGQETSYVCVPFNSSSLALTSNQSLDRKHDKNWKPLEVYIESPENDTSQLEIGSSLTVKCRFNATTLDQDLKFKLKWLRSVAGSQGYNQSISPTLNTDSDPISVTITGPRVSVLQRDGGLDLELTSFQANDSGEYFCQAISDDDSIIDEKRIQLSHASPSTTHYDDSLSADVDDQTKSRPSYSQENINRLLPSLRVIPNYVDAMPGETVRLSCITTDEQDPEPKADYLSWSYEPFDRRTPFKVWPTYDGDMVERLPENVLVYRNLLVVNSFSDDQRGFYKCSYKMPEFDLSVQASAEISARPETDSAPLVFVSPELVRLSSDGSTRLQCESTGFPAPALSWYRIENSNTTDPNNQIDSLSLIDGISVAQIDTKDAMTYCEHTDSCVALKNQPAGSRLVTAIRWVEIKHAKAHHQGQYVCKATNKHGSNQASTVVDVEFKEQPHVSIVPPEKKHQTLELPAIEYDLQRQQMPQMVFATFRCTIDLGRPKPRLRWLRPASSSTTALSQIRQKLVTNPPMQTGHWSQFNELSKFPPKQSASFDIYDLTRGVSSATSKVSTWLEDNDNTLVLSIGTISTDDEGEYVCLAENEAGSHSTVAHLAVRRPAQVRVQQPSPQLARPGQSFQLDCIASGHPAPLDIEWSRLDKGAYFSLIARQSMTSSSTAPLSNNATSAPLVAVSERAILKFDKVTLDDSGEYTCNARDPMNESKILQDTIMVLVEEPQTSNDASLDSLGQLFPADNEEQLKLMVRPTKSNVPIGSNVTLDCLAVGGLQPTVVEWLAPPLVSTSTSSLSVNKGPHNDCCDDPKSSMRFGGGSTLTLVQPYYRGTIGTKSIDGSWAFQFGSKLRIFNITKAHEGVYQCKGRNKVGTESAPALISVTDRKVPLESVAPSREQQLVDEKASPIPDAERAIKAGGPLEPPAIKTKIARAGSNIELRCQVNGVGQQPATSWSRDGLQLPAGSVQIEHNLWIQNLTASDEGLYVCSARSDEPNRIIQARIHLLVRPATDAVGDLNQQIGKPLENLRAKIVASKSLPKSGDSITLECIIELQNSTSDPPSVDLGILERQVLWTNLHSGESLFQDNVYVQENLLIIYGIRYENEAIYRCNYNELTQHVDYKLVLSDQYRSTVKQAESPINSDPRGTNYSYKQPVDSGRLLTSSSGQQVDSRSYPVGSRLVLDCASNGGNASNYLPIRSYKWFRVHDKQLIESNSSAGIMVVETIGTSDASIYHCFETTVNDDFKNTTSTRLIRSVLVQVQTVAAKFVQKPMSFVTLPAITNSDQRLELELKFLPERSHGLILFSGPQQQQSLLSTISPVSGGARSDFILLGMQRGQVEFRFELGDGVTTVRSSQNLTLHHWHKVVIERYRRSATMWIDGQVAATNSSSGKFFNLNLDSVLYVGGNQYFQETQSQPDQSQSSLRDAQITNYSNYNNSSKQPSRFYGYSNGFYGCIASLRINRRAPVPLLARGRSVSVGVFECDRPECGRGAAGTLDCGRNGICQVERPARYQPDKQRASLIYDDLRCICMPNFVGDQCDTESHQVAPMSLLSSYQMRANRTTPAASQQHQAAQTPRKQTSTASTTTGACELMTSLSSSGPCSSNGTVECESLTSTSFKCHCRLGFMGDLCDQIADFRSGDGDQNETSGETGVWFNAPAYLHLKLNNQAENQVLSMNNADALQVVAQFNASQYVKQISMTDRQNITFYLRTRASFGLLFYMGAHFANLDSGDLGPATNLADDLYRKSTNSTPMQSSKSMVANLLARLSTQSVVDYMSIALIDGHIELSYELGSGLAIIRSSRRFNDGQLHKITVLREARFGRLSVDDEMRFQGESPGKLSMLNGAGTNEIYLGGLPLVSHLKTLRRNPSPAAADDNSTSAIAAASLPGTAISYLPGAFSGCISQVHLNELGPLNLVRSDFRTQVLAARNLEPCNSPNRNEQQQLTSSVLAAQQLLSAASSGGGSSSSNGAGSNGGSNGYGYGAPVARQPHQKPSTTTTSSSDLSDDSDET